VQHDCLCISAATAPNLRKLWREKGALHSMQPAQATTEHKQ
jgi:hypothetical protein